MRISFIEIQNFRKLKSIRIDLAEDTTLFVGANNSGKTTAIIALRRFLIDQKHFDAHDFIVSSWKKINTIGAAWEKPNAPEPSMSEWDGILPAMDVWLDVGVDEIHHVQHILPTLDWNGGKLGVRLRLEPEKLQDFHNNYVAARQQAESTIAAAKKNKDQVPLWPTCMRDFLERGFNSKFRIRAYILNPNNVVDPLPNGEARPQDLPNGSEFIEGNPFDGLIRIDEINAQRGFSDAGNNRDPYNDSVEESAKRSDKRKLSDQLRSYYAKHLDPSEMPGADDVAALEAIHEAQNRFDQKLNACFAEALNEIQNLGYPGISDPTLTLSTRIKPMDGLNHASALQYDVISHQENSEDLPVRLPEQYNGLGYQNLISMVFRLMSFRDEWMQVGKIGKKTAATAGETFFPPPLHLVLVEEPEAHLHVQVQQVFIRKAYGILRNHPDLKKNHLLTTQLVVSTHSSHIAHECDFECLRYFRRKSANCPGEAPTTAVINLSAVFGKPDDTAKFVARYLKAAHCDLFFADAAIFIEGAAERMLLPHFIENNFPKLHQRYLTLLEVGGSHAHRFQPLIEYLGLTTLIVTDIDATAPVAKGAGQKTKNPTLKTWVPQKEAIDELLDMQATGKTKVYNDVNFAVRAAYQCPVKVVLDKTAEEVEITANTFEDALVYENIDIFKTLDGNGLIKKFREAVNTHKTPAALKEAAFGALNNAQSGSKAEFALELLLHKDPKAFAIPAYIREGLEWLQYQVCKKESDSATNNAKTASPAKKKAA